MYTVQYSLKNFTCIHTINLFKNDKRRVIGKLLVIMKSRRMHLHDSLIFNNLPETKHRIVVGCRRFSSKINANVLMRRYYDIDIKFNSTLEKLEAMPRIYRNGFSFCSFCVFFFFFCFSCF